MRNLDMEFIDNYVIYRYIDRAIDKYMDCGQVGPGRKVETRDQEHFRCERDKWWSQRPYLELQILDYPLNTDTDANAFEAHCIARYKTGECYGGGNQIHQNAGESEFIPFLDDKWVTVKRSPYVEKRLVKIREEAEKKLTREMDALDPTIRRQTDRKILVNTLEECLFQKKRFSDIELEMFTINALKFLKGEKVYIEVPFEIIERFDRNTYNITRNKNWKDNDGEVGYYKSSESIFVSGHEKRKKYFKSYKLGPKELIYKTPYKICSAGGRDFKIIRKYKLENETELLTNYLKYLEDDKKATLQKIEYLSDQLEKEGVKI